jgi:hypothetical protein
LLVTVDRAATQCQKTPASEVSHPGDIISEHWATLSRNARATSSEPAPFLHLAFFAAGKLVEYSAQLPPDLPK